MSEETRKILDMLAAGKITADDAEKLLAALRREEDRTAKPDSDPSIDIIAETRNGKAKFLCVNVSPKDGHSHGRHAGNVNVKIPLILLKAGVKLGRFMPEGTRDQVHEKLSKHGINVDLANLESADLDAFIEGLRETSIDVEDEEETVKIFCC